MHCLINRLAVIALVLSASAMCHASIEIGASNSGWYRNINTYNVNGNYMVQTNERRNFFVFDLTGVTNTILSATLRLDNPTVFDSTVQRVYTMYDVATDVASLLAPPANRANIYADLGSGTEYGSFSMSGLVPSGVVEITLNSDAISAMNSTSGLFAIGGVLTAGGSAYSELFAYSDKFSKRTLVLEVEEPMTNPNDGVVPEPMSAIVWAGIAVVGSLGVSGRRGRS